MKNITVSIRNALRATETTNPFLLPGEFVCRWLGVTDKESKMLLRLFVNLTVYGKIAVLILMVAMDLG